MAATPSGGPGYEISDVINDNDRGLMITSVAAILLVASCLFGFLRLWVRWPWKALLGLDDACTGLAQIIGVVQTAVVFTAVSLGLGKRDEPSANVVTIQKLVFASDLLFVVVIWLSRLAVALMFLRLSGNRERAKKMRTIATAMVALLITSVIVIAIRAHTTQPWLDSLADSTWSRWVAVGALGVLAEFALLAISVFLVWKLQMSPKQKYTVVSGFAARMILLVSLVIRLVSLHDHINSIPFTFTFTIPAIWTQLELHLSLILATVPCLRIFLKSFNTGYYGMDTTEEVAASGTVMATKGGESYNLSDLRSGGASRTQRSEKEARARVQSSGMNTSRITARGREDEDGEDAMSDGSGKRIIVRQTVDVMYDSR